MNCCGLLFVVCRLSFVVCGLSSSSWSEVCLRNNMFIISTDPKQEKRILKARARCQKKFRFYFPKGFKDQTYKEWERNYKWNAHVQWAEQLNPEEFSRLLSAEQYVEIANRAVRIETKTNLLFSFEKMALRDAVRTPSSAKAFAIGLFNYLYGKESLRQRFEKFIEVVEHLPRKQTRVLTWPLVTVFGFIAKPEEFIFLKPKVTKIAAEKYAYDFYYGSRPNWETYESLLGLANQVEKDLADWKPNDMIDIQSFLWVLGSDEYPD